MTTLGVFVKVRQWDSQRPGLSSSALGCRDTNHTQTFADPFAQDRHRRRRSGSRSQPQDHPISYLRDCGFGRRQLQLISVSSCFVWHPRRSMSTHNTSAEFWRTSCGNVVTEQKAESKLIADGQRGNRLRYPNSSDGNAFPSPADVVGLTTSWNWLRVQAVALFC